MSDVKREHTTRRMDTSSALTAISLQDVRQRRRDGSVHEHSVEAHMDSLSGMQKQGHEISLAIHSERL